MQNLHLSIKKTAAATNRYIFQAMVRNFLIPGAFKARLRSLRADRTLIPRRLLMLGCDAFVLRCCYQPLYIPSHGKKFSYSWCF
ncbi:hypothetical protein C7K08_13755 [Synechococcus lacustris str. Tous]|uniref:Uncharacterized protein n=1 Tax=Synechococcus lacustris str. Tous TaxID=1910958 RepID=A0A2P7EAS3_9SYNE|nr:hypothetical protein C7K08_13755 [Synechococcus lacustris str. Tous]